MHQRCLALLQTHPGPLVTTALVVIEAGWLIRRQLNIAAEAVFYTAITQGQLNIEPLTSTDWARSSAFPALSGDQQNWNRIAAEQLERHPYDGAHGSANASQPWPHHRGVHA